jgi:spore germination protein GerM
MMDMNIIIFKNMNKKLRLIVILGIIIFISACVLIFITIKNPAKSPDELMKVKVYFNNSKMDPEISCNKVFAVEREIPKTLAVANAALNELLNGPTDAEKDLGFFTSINEGIKVHNLTIKNGTAMADFDEQLEYQVGGSCRVSAIRAQITETLKQFSTVKNVIISINGRIEDILQP